uniref:Uncharacterized protein n=1 Tax=Hyaloperonospora arabidopsidis (strain Emoy2) TaxID=559515 RepID=M4C5G0_HYAAE
MSSRRWELALETMHCSFQEHETASQDAQVDQYAPELDVIANLKERPACHSGNCSMNYPSSRPQVVMPISPSFVGPVKNTDAMSLLLNRHLSQKELV